MTKLYKVLSAKLARLSLITLAVVPISLFSATPLDINNATASQLSAVLSGVGMKKAQAIVAYRELHGDFTSIEDLSKVKGIGPGLLEKNKSVIQVVKETE
ncbi:helix-hairpin-helix domain-containing protein [Marinomonas sp. C2222]|uniref:Helix-hairpin-helix domain-containing protein n=1 Tax=Marinomonas sargassi TaxID=2984494 RepID=A0ABT2YV43_9GAMM|nr:helix-hairpin-helix domain-containing protein [Marinomonas sargassi]MCV2403767.1 helix-hairpin-helix domain-containing protein [Marinomonas sargassi]